MARQPDSGQWMADTRAKEAVRAVAVIQANVKAWAVDRAKAKRRAQDRAFLRGFNRIGDAFPAR